MLRWINVSRDPLPISPRNLADLGLMDSFQGNFYNSYKLIINFYRTKIFERFHSWNGILKIKPAYSFFLFHPFIPGNYPANLYIRYITMYNWFVIRDSFVETPSIQGELTNSKNFRYDDWLTPTYLYFAPDFSPRDYDGRVSNSTRSSYVYRCISTGWSQNFLEARCPISAQPEEEDPRWRDRA